MAQIYAFFNVQMTLHGSISTLNRHLWKTVLTWSENRIEPQATQSGWSNPWLGNFAIIYKEWLDWPTTKLVTITSRSHLSEMVHSAVKWKMRTELTVFLWSTAMTTILCGEIGQFKNCLTEVAYSSVQIN